MGARFAIDLALGLSLLLAPWWFIFWSLLLAFFYFPRFYEGVYFALLADLLFAFNTFYATLTALILFLVINYLRSYFRRYADLQI